MFLRPSRVGLAIALLVVPAVARAQVGIEHQDVGCIVVGQFPVLDACFRPGTDLARARVFFRPEGAPSWYYVEASTAAPPAAGEPDLLCRKATLPKPKKVLLEKHVEYYLEATGKRLESTQTATYRPLVVRSEGECKGKLIAGFVPKATVQVFPALPAAFAAGGGLSGSAVAAVVGAGVAGGTGAVVAATSGGGGPAPTTATPATAPPTTAPPATAPPTTTTTTVPATPFNPVFKVFRNGSLETSSTIVGTEPVTLRFVMCETTGPLRLKFNVSVNGGLSTAGCDSTVTFTAGGFAPGFGAVGSSRVGSTAASYDVRMQIQSDGPGNNPKEARALTVDVSAATTTTTTTTLPPCAGDTQGPSVTLTSPINEVYPFPTKYPVVFTASASDPEGNLIDRVEYTIFGDLTPVGEGRMPPDFRFPWMEVDV
ncbi:MAG TPA: hypothetical protein VGB42_04150, partial [Candidatus Thermoplasmatota archaeon]